MHSLRDRDNLEKKKLGRKVDSAVPREREWLSKKLHEAEAYVEARNEEKRNSDIAFHEINQNLSLNDFSYIKQVMGRSGSERQNQLVWRIGIEK